MDANEYKLYRERREFEDSLKVLKESCMFNPEECEGMPAEETPAAEPETSAEDTAFIDADTEENQYIKDIRKLAFKGMAAEEEAGRVHSEVYERLKKLFLDLDKRNDSKMSGK